MDHMEPVFRELKEIVGDGNVIIDSDLLSQYETTTFSTSQRVPLVVLPASTEEVQAVVKVANHHRLPLYPVSRGRNWGLGSRVPFTTGCCVVDLKRMNRILEIDEKNAVMTVEPGVTFQQAADALEALNSKLFLSAIGGPPDSSVLANALERGDGVGPAGDRAKHCCGLEVVLPTGERLDTGLAVFKKSLTKSLSLFGLGPAVEGLFFQSNLGIVTKMSVYLSHRPPAFQCVALAVKSEDELLRAIAEIRKLHQLGVLKDCSISVWNVYRFLTAQVQYPWDGRDEPLPPEELLAKLPSAWKGVRWVAFLGVYSPSTAHARASSRMIRRALKKNVSKYLAVGRVSATIARALKKPIQRLTGIDVERMVDGMYFKSAFLGNPTKMEVSSVYWRKRSKLPAEADPDRDRCGLHWVCVALPFDGHHIARVTGIVDEVAIAHGLEPMSMYFNMNQWYLKSFIVIMFDRDVPAEEETARICHDEMLARLIDEGYAPTRLGLQSAGVAPDQQEYVDTVGKLKKLLDPNDILAPNRYDFRSRWSTPHEG